MKLQLSTWPEVETYLRRSTAVLIPIGSTEQHGPTGFVGTDALCPEVLAEGIAERSGALVAPTLSIGMAQHHLGFPGSITLRPTTLIAVVQDVVNSLARHGFDRFFFLNGHGGNIATVNAAFAEVQAERSLQGQSGLLELTLFNWFAGRRGRELAESLYGDAEGGHATPSEVSLSWFARPEAVKQVAMTPKVAPGGSAQCDADEFRRRFPDGRMGSDPSLASVEHGARFLEAGVEDAWEAYRAFTGRA